MHIDIPEKNWLKFKRELPSIIIVSALQVWWSFNSPFVTRLGLPWSSMLAIITSIVGVGGIAYVFSFVDKIAPALTLEYFDTMLHGRILKRMYLIVLPMILFLFWYKDLYHMSNMYYGIVLTMCVLTYVLLYRAVRRGYADLMVK